MGLMDKIKKAKQNKKGFTLVEIIVVLVILAILSSIMVPAMTGWIDKANEKKLFVKGRTLMVACQTIASENYGATTPTITLKAANDLANVEGGAVKVAKYDVKNVITYMEAEVDGKPLYYTPAGGFTTTVPAPIPDGTGFTAGTPNP